MKKWGLLISLLTFTMTGCGLETIASMPTMPEKPPEAAQMSEAEGIPAEEVNTPQIGVESRREHNLATVDEIMAAKGRHERETEQDEPLDEAVEEETEEAVLHDDAPVSGDDGAGGDPEDSTTLWGVCTISFYCPCGSCCGEWAGGATASGVMPTPNHTVACELPFGTRLLIGGQEYVVEDRGVSGMWVDVFVTDHQEALNRGLYQTEVYVIE